MRAMALAPSSGTSNDARTELKRWRAEDLFPNAPSPEGAFAGLNLYFSCIDEAHKIAQDLNTPEAASGMAFCTQEPNPGNAAIGSGGSANIQSSRV